MNLLRMMLAMVLAASLAVILNSTAKAVDHPWDDNSVDSTQGAGYKNTYSVGDPNPAVIAPLLQRFENWTRHFIRQISVWQFRAPAVDTTKNQKSSRLKTPAAERKFK